MPHSKSIVVVSHFIQTDNYLCKDCKMTLRGDISIRLHMKTRHPQDTRTIGGSSLVCAYCKAEGFKNKLALLNHTKNCKHKSRKI